LRRRAARPALRAAPRDRRRGVRSARTAWNVSLVTSPAQTRSQRASPSSGAKPPRAAASSCGKNEAPRAARTSRSRSWIGRSGRSRGSGRSRAKCSARKSAIFPSRGPSAPPPIHMTWPEPSNASRSRGSYFATRAGRMRVSRSDAGTKAPCSFWMASRSAAVPRSGASIPCHATAKRAKASCSTGSTSRRSRASDLPRSVRKTPASHHSLAVAPGRNWPSTVVPASASLRSASCTGVGATENRRDLAKERAALRRIDGERLRPELGKGRGALVHEVRDVVEEQRGREGRRPLRVHRDDPDPPGADRREELDEPRHVEHVLEDLAVRLEHDREPLITARDGEQVASAPALLPQGRPLAGTAPRKQEGARGVLAETRGEERRGGCAEVRGTGAAAADRERCLHAFAHGVGIGK